ncbi:hypothetical protein GIB67_032135 [Kingdonia uniflora]|uniref:MADS-box domain-containing protein n=1 Tax=Kingdonia uniflora TaxID=39325 RepID=A0A7J7MX47_9MAGN|nr:hypothetical protein GIB67_032135 [Kingdonia uniflora]
MQRTCKLFLLCDTEIGLIVFSYRGRLEEFSTDRQQVIFLTLHLCSFIIFMQHVACMNILFNLKII